MWEINITTQALTFLYAVILGALLCIFYDIIRAFRKAGLNGNISVFITDILFWLVNTFLTFVFLMATTNGQFRVFVLVAELIGFVICRLSLSKLLFPFFKIILGAISKMFGIISYYSAVGCFKIEQLLHSFNKLFRKNLKIALKEVKKLLKNGWKMLYTNRNNIDLEHRCDDQT